MPKERAEKKHRVHNDVQKQGILTMLNLFYISNTQIVFS